MNEQKRNSIAAAITINVILLIAVLAIVAVYQLVVMATAARLKSEYIAEIQKYKQQTEEAEDYLEYIKSEEYLRDYAFYLGWHYRDNSK